MHALNHVFVRLYIQQIFVSSLGSDTYTSEAAPCTRPCFASQRTNQNMLMRIISLESDVTMCLRPNSDASLECLTCSGHACVD